jgi:hypothetical protein
MCIDDLISQMQATMLVTLLKPYLQFFTQVRGTLYPVMTSTITLPLDVVALILGWTVYTRRDYAVACLVCKSMSQRLATDERMWQRLYATIAVLVCPKRGLTAYLIYTLAHQDIRTTNPDLSFGDLAKLLANQWKSMSEETKQPFVEQSKQDKMRYERELQRGIEMGQRRARWWGGGAADCRCNLVDYLSMRKSPSITSHGVTTPLPQLRAIVRRFNDCERLALSILADDASSPFNPTPFAFWGPNLESSLSAIVAAAIRISPRNDDGDENSSGSGNEDGANLAGAGTVVECADVSACCNDVGRLESWYDFLKCAKSACGGELRATKAERLGYQAVVLYAFDDVGVCSGVAFKLNEF